ncbi:WD repeat and FYVE domain-containing protein 3, partial [Cichlidogyrus casuarinus]
QRGEAAAQANNVFHPLFYEGNVDIYSITNPVKRQTIIGFINNFGQVPKQLFVKPHPARRVLQCASSSSSDVILDADELKTMSTWRGGCFLASRLFYHNIPRLRPCPFALLSEYAKSSFISRKSKLISSIFPKPAWQAAV